MNHNCFKLSSIPYLSILFLNDFKNLIELNKDNLHVMFMFKTVSRDKMLYILKRWK